MRKILMLMFVVFTLLITGCIEEKKDDYSAKEEDMVKKNQAGLLSAQPPVHLDWSLERDQINKRTKLWNDKNKVSFIYLISYGKVMAFYTIKGKVSSVNSQITNPSMAKEFRIRGVGYNTVVLPSPAEDGSYGSNGDGIFFFTTDGTYVEWAGSYMLADKPLKLSTPPELVRTVK